MTKNDHVAWLSQHVAITFERDVPISTHPHADTDAPIEVLHYHDCIELSQCTEGCGLFFLSNALRSYQAGDCFLIPEGCRHRSQSAPNTSAAWRTLYLDWSALQVLAPASGFRWKLLPMMHLGFADALDMGRWMDAVFAEYEARAPHWKVALGGHLLVLLTGLQRLRRHAHVADMPGQGERGRLAPALNYIAENVGDGSLNVASLAERCHMSEPHFRRLFARQMGQSPKQFITRTRIELARSMLTDPSLTVLEVAFSCGYESISAFNRAFLQITQMKPTRWRQLAGKAE